MNFNESFIPVAKALERYSGSRHACLCNDVRGMQGLVGFSENIVHSHYILDLRLVQGVAPYLPSQVTMIVVFVEESFSPF